MRSCQTSYDQQVPTDTAVAPGKLLRPGWVAMHVVIAVLFAAMVWAGWWQWSRGVDSGALRNYAYGLEWWAFALFSVGAWVKFCRDEVVDPPAPLPVAPLPPPVAPVVDDSDDPELAAWNARFRELAEKDRR